MSTPLVPDTATALTWRKHRSEEDWTAAELEQLAQWAMRDFVSSCDPHERIAASRSLRCVRRIAQRQERRAAPARAR